MDSRRDVLVGLFVLTTLGVIAGALIVTSGFGDVRYDLYVRTESAQDLTRDTRVLLQGLEIGRVQQLNPVRSGTAGTLSFVGRLAINERFPDGTQVVLPVGSTALIGIMGVNFIFNVVIPPHRTFIPVIGKEALGVGPVLLGADKPVQILTPSATVRRIVNMTAVTVADANAARA